jgi:tetratricopeptide (TPR) repeat protein
MADAEKFYRLALDHALKLVQQAPTVPENARLLGQCDHNLASLFHLKLKRYADAEQILRQGISRLEKLAADFPGVTEYRYRLADFHCFLGGPVHALGRRLEAEDCNRRAVELYEQLAAEFPSEFRYRDQLALNCRYLAQHQFFNGRSQEGRRSYQRAVELWEQLLADFPAAPELSAAWWLNGHAWFLVSHADGSRRAGHLAVAMAKRAVEQVPKAGYVINTLGTAYYRAGDWNAAIETLQKVDEATSGKHFGYNAFFIAMAHWQLGNKDEARQWYGRAVEWTDKNQPKNEELRRFQAEAAELMGIKKKKD